MTLIACGSIDASYYWATTRPRCAVSWRSSMTTITPLRDVLETRATFERNAVILARRFLKEILELHKRGGLGDGSPPAESRGGTPVGRLGNEVPQKLKHTVVYCNKI